MSYTLYTLLTKFHIHATQTSYKERTEWRVSGYIASRNEWAI